MRVALLEADVALPVVKDFLSHVKERALGHEVRNSLNPGQQFLKIVEAELTSVMGEENHSLEISVQPPAVILMTGMQGSGKTTSSAKLARYLKERHRKKVMMVSVDRNRAAAIKQLEILASEVGVDFFPTNTIDKPTETIELAIAAAKKTISETGTTTSNAWDFDGSNDYVNLGTGIANALANTDEVTYSLWFNMHTLPTGQGTSWDLVHTHHTNWSLSSNGADYTGIGINNWYDGNWYIYPYYQSGNESYGRISATNLGADTVDTWYHMTLVFDGAGSTNADRWKVYLNGVEKTWDSFQGSNDIPTTIPYGNYETKLANPMYSSTYSKFFDGQIDNFAIYDAMACATEQSDSLKHMGRGL